MTRFDVMHKAIFGARTIEEAVAAYEIVCLLENLQSAITPDDKAELREVYHSVMTRLSN